MNRLRNPETALEILLVDFQNGVPDALEPQLTAQLTLHAHCQAEGDPAVSGPNRRLYFDREEAWLPGDLHFGLGQDAYLRQDGTGTWWLWRRGDPWPQPDQSSGSTELMSSRSASAMWMPR